MRVLTEKRRYYIIYFIINLLFLGLTTYKLDLIPSPHFDESIGLGNIYFHIKYISSFTQYPLFSLWPKTVYIWQTLFNRIFEIKDQLFLFRFYNVFLSFLILNYSFFIIKKITGIKTALMFCFFYSIFPITFVNFRLHSGEHPLVIFFAIIGFLHIIKGYHLRLKFDIITGNILILISLLINFVSILFFITILLCQLIFIFKKGYFSLNKKFKTILLSCFIILFFIIILTQSITDPLNLKVSNITISNSNVIKSVFIEISNYFKLLTGEFVFKAVSGVWFENKIIRYSVMTFFLLIIFYLIYKRRKLFLFKLSIFSIFFYLLFFEVGSKIFRHIILLKYYYHIRYLLLLAFVFIFIFVVSTYNLKSKIKFFIFYFTGFFYLISIFTFYFYEFETRGGICRIDNNINKIHLFCNQSTTGTGEMFYLTNSKKNIYHEISEYIKSDPGDIPVNILSVTGILWTMRLYIRNNKYSFIDIWSPNLKKIFIARDFNHFYYINFCYDFTNKLKEAGYIKNMKPEEVLTLFKTNNILRYYSVNPIERLKSLINYRKLIIEDRRYFNKTNGKPIIVCYKLRIGT